MSFNFGPTLLRWIEAHMPAVYQRILGADRVSLERLGHGNALAQPYDHVILPLATERDRETELIWGISDFEQRFRRRPEAVWLPETAVNEPTLGALVRHNMRFVILSPFQALRVRPFGEEKWLDVSKGRIDTTQPYRCFVRDSSGRKDPERYIDIFFYQGTLSKEVGFGDLLKDAHLFCSRFVEASHPLRGRPQLIHIATDGETYGHHKKFGEMALAYALRHGLVSRGMEITNYGAFLDRFPPLYEVEIDEGPEGEGTSWSCFHGVDRWKEDCGCSTGAAAGWNQKWRKPLREAVDFLRDRLAVVFEEEGAKLFHDPWEARNGYVHLIRDRSSEARKRFFERFGRGEMDEKRVARALQLLEMERHSLQMFTSCGWFFADLAGLETLIVLQHASRAMELAEGLTGHSVEEEFLQILAEARSNLPEMGDGRQIYERHVKPRSFGFEKVVSHYAFSFFTGEKEKKVFGFRVEGVEEEKVKLGELPLLIGHVKVTSEIIPEEKGFLFAVASFEKEPLRAWVSECGEKASFSALKDHITSVTPRDQEERKQALDSKLGDRSFTLRDLPKEEQERLFGRLFRDEIFRYRRACSDLFDVSNGVAKPLVAEGFRLPSEFRLAAEISLRDRLLEEIRKLREDLNGATERSQIDGIIEEAQGYGLTLWKEPLESVLQDWLNDRVRTLKEVLETRPSTGAERIDELLLLLQGTKRWGVEIRKEEAQDQLYEVLESLSEAIEEDWWERGVVRSFPENLLALAEKLGLSVDRFRKFVLPSRRPS